jgi:hypothetical protein
MYFTEVDLTIWIKQLPNIKSNKQPCIKITVKKKKPCIKIKSKITQQKILNNEITKNTLKKT